MKKLLLLLLVIINVVGCTKDDKKTVEKDYGKEGSHIVQSYTIENNIYSTVYYPADISSMATKSPIVFLASGWFSEPQTSKTYETLISFIVSHGYTVLYTYEGATTNPQYSISGYESILENGYIKTNILPYADTSKIGIVGSSAGGGITFPIMKHFSDKGYGTNGRFILALDPWFAFDMNEEDMKTLPTNLNVVIIKFGEGGNNAADGTDARIPLTEYYLLESVATKNKDYQIYPNADHGYPKGQGSYEDMQGILKPLDALLDYTFVKQDEASRIIALENGNDDPYDNGNGIQVVKPKNEYGYPCDGASTLIDYCQF